MDPYYVILKEQDCWFVGQEYPANNSLLTVTLQSGDPAEISCCGGKYFPPDICYKTLSKFYTAQFVFCTGTQYCVVSWLSSKLPWVCRVLHYSSVHCTVGRAWQLYKMSCSIFITSLLH